MFLGVIALSTTAQAKPDCDKSSEIISTNSGKLCGIQQQRSSQTAEAYLGVPFAKPPVGKLRWKAPEPIGKFDQDVFQATQLGNNCVQPSGESKYKGSEDCLNLNIWKPKGDKKNLPVMIFIPGGGFVVGAGGLEIYNGTYLAAKHDVIVVTLNYRLGALGFLRYMENATNIKGNFGLLDQITAMKWIKENIKNFGGDPDKITLFGESAGAMSVGFHLMSVPKSNDLFRAAIMESNPYSVPYADAIEAELVGKNFVKLINKNIKDDDAKGNDLEWLQSLPVDAIMQSQDKTLPGGIFNLVINGMAQGTWWTPTVGVSPVTGQPMDGYHEGNSPKPYVFGLNKNEGIFFMPDPNKFTKSNLKKALLSDFGNIGYKNIINFKDKEGNAIYNPNNYDSDSESTMTPAAQAMSKIMTDYSFGYGNLHALQKSWDKQSISKEPVYSYYFSKQSSFNYQNLERCLNEVCHTYELPYVFHNFVVKQPDGTQTTVKNASENDIALANLMSKSWAGFAKDPYDWKNGFGYPPLDSISKGKYVHFKTNPKIANNLTEIINYPFWGKTKTAQKIWLKLGQAEKPKYKEHESSDF
ncbi:carboxylesterase family protein [Francisella adeliensis]|uniref:Carboxylic ester hydrolase n=1 Tax=Francisella adeliensis TaxID=2007306 RepID=A0A2Z4XZL0_9GAMM|nr:carboxylesterase family protein [Francisella adeliensis]AXA34200.1 hypothetical protein CDH04_07195 [Francisella adeliensis]MBK2084839.1 carboxylesterase family protein [Francisella adeliensis]MBK2096330.1 carboxylesterase family protein [Francisella adeliensis]QIW12444.1 carboxylesterase family protein [Francisella adeliensis]QIW14317.1 carboxylesterase family protein [Francisella adeliensis]